MEKDGDEEVDSTDAADLTGGVWSGCHAASERRPMNNWCHVQTALRRRCWGRVAVLKEFCSLKLMCHFHRSLRQSFIHVGVTSPCVRWMRNVRLTVDFFEFFVNGHIFTTVELNLFMKTDFVLMKVIFLFVKLITDLRLSGYIWFFKIKLVNQHKVLIIFLWSKRHLELKTLFCKNEICT